MVLLDSPWPGWAPQLLLAALALADFGAQAALPAVVTTGWPGDIPPGVLDFLANVVGESRRPVSRLSLEA